MIIFKSIAALVATAVGSPAGLDIAASLQNILANANNSPLYTYPTDLTRGIIPKPIHSHNDYWRDLPFYTALSHGCISIEADVWHYASKNDTIYVGHEPSALTEGRTFSSLYIQPILDVLQRQNPPNSFVMGPTKNGVFDMDSAQTLYLFVDVKTDGSTTWPYIVEALQPLRDAGYLTTYDGTDVTTGPVTVIGTGNAPLNQIQPVMERDYFFDAPLDLLGSTFANITAAVSPIASTSFNDGFGPIHGTFNAYQLALLDLQILTARAKGIASRYWEQPAWPVTTRDYIWTILVEHGTGLINADDVAAAAGHGGRSGYW